MIQKTCPLGKHCFLRGKRVAFLLNRARGSRALLRKWETRSHGRDDASRFTFWWPGDDYVDVMGYDYYEGETPDVLRANLQTLSRVAAEKRKPCAVTEAGLEAFKNPHYWTQQILEPATSEGVRLSFIVFWRNKYVGNNEKDTHYFSVFPGHPSEEDFRQFYQSPRTFFSNDLPPMYRRAKGIRVR